MPLSVAELQPALHELFTGTARELAKDTGFCQRERDLTGPVFCQTLTFCLLENPDASLDDFAENASRHGTVVTPNAFDGRFTRPAAALMLGLLLEAFRLRFASLRPALLPLLRRFEGVYLRDATSVTLPPCLAEHFPGRKGRHCAQGAGPAEAPGEGSAEAPAPDQAQEPAAAKLVLEVEVSSGQFTELSLLPGTANEKAAHTAGKPLPKGCLLLEDMGFFCGERLQGLMWQGVYFLTRVPAWTAFFQHRRGKYEPLDLVKWLRKLKKGYGERQVVLLNEQKLHLRLLAVRVPEEVAEQRRQRVRDEAKKRGRPVSQKKLDLCEWNVLVTNAPRGLLKAREAFDLRRVRWQIELVFRVFKSEGGIARARSEKRWRVLAELFAKLLGQVAQQWLLLAAGYVMLAFSARRAARRVRRRAADLLRALGSAAQLRAQVGQLAAVLLAHCRVKRRRKTPSTLDRLTAHDPLAKPLEQAV